MLTCNLKGRLGNLLFQISATYALALENGDECGFDFNRVDILSTVSSSRDPIRLYRETIFSRLRVIEKDKTDWRHYPENGYRYAKIPYSRETMLDGYFQSEGYFINKKNEIRELFAPLQPMSAYIAEKYGDLLSRRTVSIHVRRGDYVVQQKCFPLCSMEYYARAIARFDSSYSFLIFSDDIEWCRSNFKGTNLIFVSGETDVVDLYLMSMCDHNIIANSTFSWWGAWLNDNPEKKVIAPKMWFGASNRLDARDLIPSQWINVD